MNENIQKHHVYAKKIASQIVDMMLNEECENYISLDELSEADNFTHFIHALANEVPCLLVSRFAPSMNISNNLEMNHLANTLCLRFMKIEG